MWPFSKTHSQEVPTRMVLIEKTRLDGSLMFDSIRRDIEYNIIPALIKEMRKTGINSVRANWHGAESWDIERLYKLQKELHANGKERLHVNHRRDAEELVSFADNLISRTEETREMSTLFKAEAKRIHEASKKLSSNSQ